MYHNPSGIVFFEDQKKKTFEAFKCKNCGATKLDKNNKCDSCGTQYIINK